MDGYFPSRFPILFWPTVLLVIPKTVPEYHRRETTPQSCQGLFTNGRYEKQGTPARWVPAGCSLKTYNKDETKECFYALPKEKRKRAQTQTIVTFIGDSRIRQLRDELFSHLTGRQIDWLSNATLKYDRKVYEKHRDKIFRLNPVKLELLFTRDIESAAERVQRFVDRSLDRQDYPDLIVTGNAIWTIHFCIQWNISEHQCLKKYERGLKLLFNALVPLENKVPVLWVPHGYIGESGNASDRTHSSKIAEAYNDVAKTVLEDRTFSGITYWTSFALAFHQMNDSLDRLHVGPFSKGLFNQMLLNLLCNSRLPSRDSGSYCCSQLNEISLDYSWPDKAGYFLLPTALFIAVIMLCFRHILKYFCLRTKAGMHVPQ